MDMCRKIVILLYFLATVLSTYAEICAVDKCIDLEQCTGLNSQLEGKHASDVSDQLRQQLRQLFCGFNSINKPMICCPPEHYGSIALLPDISTCGIMDSNRIYGGGITEIDEHPWMALVRYKIYRSASEFYCGGVLISSRYVLTAAHCVTGPELTGVSFEVRLGEWNTSSDIDCVRGDCSLPPLDVPVEQAIAHGDYSSSSDNQQNDIALLRLSYDVTFTDFVKPICLPINSSLKQESFEGADMVVAGWGEMETKAVSPVKLKLTIPVVKNSVCQSKYSLIPRQISNKQICAGGRLGEDSCRGDSGGPLMHEVQLDDRTKKWMAVGVVSYGPTPCGTPGWPGMYTRVTEYTEWILSKLRP